MATSPLDKSGIQAALTACDDALAQIRRAVCQHAAEMNDDALNDLQSRVRQPLDTMLHEVAGAAEDAQ
ncbi:hypothetical protein CKO28_01180 [Rhodovibrio sodomensis]|uniref:Uncharacterized protein n=1 Tax=Rhodovibrio sodomensis TaxID=1088 RepID=A0ABS1D9K5_9PROT|nr:hypothetical protein [Rhodovibrio sodomensis]MBK1666656.1 hypothetical protein [Rhodovibrio sodomensis]